MLTMQYNRRSHGISVLLLGFKTSLCLEAYEEYFQSFVVGECANCPKWSRILALYEAKQSAKKTNAGTG